MKDGNTKIIHLDLESFYVYIPLNIGMSDLMGTQWKQYIFVNWLLD